MTSLTATTATHHSDRSTIGSYALTVIHCNSDLSANKTMRKPEGLNKGENLQGIKWQNFHFGI